MANVRAWLRVRVLFVSLNSSCVFIDNLRTGTSEIAWMRCIFSHLIHILIANGNYCIHVHLQPDDDTAKKSN